MNEIKINIKFKPTPLQKQIYEAFRNDANSFIICKLGRRSGKSYLGVYTLLRFCLENKNSKNIAVFPTFRLAKEIFDIFLSKVDGTPLIKRYSRSDYVIELYNGSKVDFYSATNADSIRGKTYDGMGLIDESAFISDYAIQEVILPAFATAKKPKFLIVSTPRFKKGFFFDYYSKGLNKSAKCISFSGPSTSSPYVNEDFLNLMKQTLTDRQYKTEILAEWLDASDGVFNYKNANIHEITPYKKCWGAIDTGKTDKSSVSIISEHGEVVHVVEFNGTDYTIIMNKMLSVIKEYNCDQVWMEVNGVGSPLFDFMKKEFRDMKPFTTTNSSKNKLIEDLALGLEKGTLKIYDEYFDLLTNQMDNVSVDYNPSTRNIRYLFSRDENGHCDSLFSTGLAYQAYLANGLKGDPKIHLSTKKKRK